MKNPPNMELWQGRTDTLEGELGTRWHQVIRPLGDPHEAQSNAIALIGFACDAGVARNHGRVGAAGAPNVLRKFLANIPAQAQQRTVDAGDVVCEGDGLEAAQHAFAHEVTQLLQQGFFPIGMGGGHEIAFASFSGWADFLAENHSQPKIGIINLDAHFDLRRDAQATSGTPFLQITQACERRGWAFNYCCLGVSEFANTQALFARAEALNVTWRLDTDMRPTQLDAILAQLAQFIAPLDAVYLTIDLDVLPASVVPAVSAPAALGVELSVIETIVDALCASGKLHLVDVAEFNPTYDIDGHSARVAARLIARVARQMLHQMTERNTL